MAVSMLSIFKSLPLQVSVIEETVFLLPGNIFEEVHFGYLRAVLLGGSTCFARITIFKAISYHVSACFNGTRLALGLTHRSVHRNVAR